MAATRRRLTLNTTGIKSPTDVGEQPAQAAVEPAPATVTAPSKPKRAAKPTPKATRPTPATRPGSPPPFYGAGRPMQTSVAVDVEQAARLEELARAAGVPVNALAVAALHEGLPLDAGAVREAIVAARVRRAGGARRRELNLRLAEQLRARVDELVAAARDELPRATRADLVNAALEVGLPDDAHAAARLVAEHAQRVERAAAA